jgi:hypothetical protein
MKTLYSLLTMSLMVSLTSIAYAQAPSYSVNCQPAYLYPDNGYQMGVYNLQIGSTQYGSNNADTDGGYRSNPTFVYELNPSTEYTLSVVTGAFYAENVRVYIDYNGDGTFGEDELIFTSSGIQSHNGNFTTPSFVSENNVWIRVMSDWTGSPEITNSCQDLEGGQAEDFVAALKTCGPSVSVSCEPITKFLDTDYGAGVWGLEIGGTSFSSGGVFQEGGYKANPCSEFTLESSTLYSITVTTGTDYDEKLNVWIDYNNDGDFNDDGELVFTSSGARTTHSGSFTTPFLPENLKVWVRVSTDATFVSNELASCSASEYGQVEDFVANLVGAPIVCGPSVSVSCEPITKFLDTDYGAGVWGLEIGGTSFSSGGVFQEGGYKANPCSEFTLESSTLYSITVTTGTDYDEKLNVWIDYNNDGDFNDDGELIFTSSGARTTHSGSFTTPFLPENLKVWVRVSTDATFVSNELASCSASEYGQVEDFVANLIAGELPPVEDGPTQIVAKFCGTTITAMSTTISALAVSGAEMYEFVLTSQSDASVITSQRVGRTTRLNLFEGVKYNTTYSAKVRAYVGGAWTNFGPSCNLTSPDYPLVSLTAKLCETTLTSMKTNMSCNIADFATDYEWEFTSLSDASVITIAKGSDKRTMSSNEAGLKYETSYSVRIRPYIEGEWRAFGSSCNITTPNYQTTSVAAKFCGTTLSTMNTKMSCTAADLATDYEWEFTSLSDASVINKLKGSTTRTMTPNEAGLAQGTTYSIRVRPYIDGEWRAYGAACEVTTPGTAAREINSEEVFVEEIISENNTNTDLIETTSQLNIFPSPAKLGQQVSLVTNNFSKNDDKVTLIVTDLVGKIIVSKDVNNTNGYVREYLNFDSNLSAGIYMVTIIGTSDKISSRLIIE